MMKVPFIDINFSGLPGISVKVFNMVDLIHSQALWGGRGNETKKLDVSLHGVYDNVQ
mgnify:CR=1 FL=1|jgi:hypothetical protein